MRTRFLIALAGLALLTSIRLSVAADAPPHEPQSLFNGKDLTGWTLMNGGLFSVTNGVIHLEKSMGWLRSEKQYADFILEVEWRALETNYNSGVFIRAGLVGTPFPTNAWQVNLKESAIGQLLRGKPEVLPSKTPAIPVKEWAKYRIEVRGKTITLEVNQKPTWSYIGLDVDHGYLGLQAEGHSMEFRNLRIAEIPATDSAK